MTYTGRLLNFEESGGLELPKCKCYDFLGDTNKKSELKYVCQHCGKKTDKLQEPTRYGAICMSCYLDII